MRLDISRQRRATGTGRPPSYVIRATLDVSEQEGQDIAALSLGEHALEAGDDDGTTVDALLGGQEFAFESARAALDFEDELVGACSDFAELLIDSLEFGGRDEYELPLEDDEDEDEDE